PRRWPIIARNAADVKRVRSRSPAQQERQRQSESDADDHPPDVALPYATGRSGAQVTAEDRCGSHEPGDPPVHQSLHDEHRRRNASRPQPSRDGLLRHEEYGRREDEERHQALEDRVRRAEQKVGAKPAAEQARNGQPHDSVATLAQLAAITPEAGELTRPERD